MPTPKKIEQVAQIKELIETSTISIAANNAGVTVETMTAMRRALRDNGVKLRIVKNNLAYIAADEAGMPQMKDVITGPTGIVFGFDDPAVAAKTFTEFLTATRAPMTVVGGMLGDRVLTADEIKYLATLPSKEVMIAKLLGQMQAPIAGLVGTLQAPIRNLAYVLNAPQVGLVTALKAIADRKAA